MLSDIPVFTVNLPGYSVDKEPDYKRIGKIVDDEIRCHFLGQTIAVRGLGSQEHPEKSVDDMVEIIKELGTDRYDPNRAGDRHENIENKQIDLHVLRRTVSEKSQIFWQLAWSFYEFPRKLGKPPVLVDILIIYDIKQLKALRTVHNHDGKLVTKRDGYIFRDPSNKPRAVKAIFKIQATSR